uniref:Uncharacterized protein n=1 Tax=Octopus bimaculoides TaxID=37653 RepID=A0A0L8GT69_OCTBM
MNQRRFIRDHPSESYLFHFICAALIICSFKHFEMLIFAFVLLIDLFIIHTICV